jgi:ketosteroid isomerase-like protein
MESSRKLRRELTFEFAKLNGLQRSVDLTVDDASAKALATEVRNQAGVCLKLLDKYQLGLPGRMRSYSEGNCQRFREDLKRTEMRFRDASGQFQLRLQGESERHHTADTRWRGFYELEEALGSSDLGPYEEQEDEISSTSPAALSRCYIEAQNDRDIDALMALVDEDVEFKLAFDPPLKGSAAVRRHFEREWADNECIAVDITDVFETEDKVAIEIHVDNGPPTNLLYNGVVVQRWNSEGRLAHHQLYVDEVIPAEVCL